jgi:hypothetical protein
MSDDQQLYKRAWEPKINNYTEPDSQRLTIIQQSLIAKDQQLYNRVW